MKRSKFFCLRKIENGYYIFPFGDATADYKKSVKTNEVGAFIWEELKDSIQTDELIEKTVNNFDVGGRNTEEIENDVKEFLRILDAYDMLQYDYEEPLLGVSERVRVNLAGCRLRIESMGISIPSEFQDFTGNPTKGEGHLAIDCMDHDISLSGERLIDRNGFVLLDKGDYYMIYGDDSNEYDEDDTTYYTVFMNKNKNEARINYTSDFPFVEPKILPVMRYPISYFLAKESKYFIHSASVLYNGRLYLFTAPSGTGKSTHAGLWEDSGCGIQINGDTNLCGINEEGIPTVYGNPWCGTSGVYSSEDYPLGGVVILTRGEENRVENLSKEEKVELVLKRVISPMWDEKLFDGALEFVKSLVEKVMVARLACTPEKEAFEVMKNYIDNWENEE